MSFTACGPSFGLSYFKNACNLLEAPSKKGPRYSLHLFSSSLAKTIEMSCQIIWMECVAAV